MWDLFEDSHLLSSNHLILVDEHLMLLKSHRYALIHLEKLLQAIGCASVLCVEDFARGEVVDAVVEAQLGYFVVLLDKLFDLSINKNL